VALLLALLASKPRAYGGDYFLFIADHPERACGKFKAETVIPNEWA
jgi:hypothetical protein